MTPEQKEAASFMRGAVMAYNDCADILRRGAAIDDMGTGLSKILDHYASAMGQKARMAQAHLKKEGNA